MSLQFPCRTIVRPIALSALLVAILTAPAFTLAGTLTWTGGGANNNMSTTANWTSSNDTPPPGSNDLIIFAGTTRLNPVWNLGTSPVVSTVTFNASAGAFNATGQFEVKDGITNNSTNTQTFSTTLRLRGNGAPTINAAAGDLNFAGIDFNGTSDTVTFTGGNDITVGGINGLTNPAANGKNITKTGTGTLTINGVNVANNPDTISLNLSGGTLVAGSNNALAFAKNLNFSGTSQLDVGAASPTFSTLSVAASAASNSTITGSGSVTVNGASDLQIGPNAAFGASAPTLNVVNLANLSNFTVSAAANTFRVGLGTSASSSNGNYGEVARLTLGGDNQITAATLAVGDRAAASDGGVSNLYLGQTNTLHVGALNLATGGRNDATLAFAAGLTNPEVFIRGVSGGASAVADWNIGTVATFATSNQTTFTANANFSAGSLDARVANLVVGTADTFGSTNRGRQLNASFTMGAGTLVVETMTLGRITGSGTVGATFGADGVFTLNHASGVVQAATINLAENTITAAGSTRLVHGEFNLTAGTLRATTLQRGLQTGNAADTLAFNWTNGTLGNITGADLNIINVPLTLISGTHTFDATSGRSIIMATSSPLSGGGGLTKSGAGRLVFNTANTYAGTTLISGGTLEVDNGTGSATGNGGVTIGAAGNLAGIGTISGLVTTSAKTSRISPGNSPGTLSLLGGLNAAAGATFNLEVGAISDLIDLGGGLFTGSTAADGLRFNFTNTGSALVGVAYTLIEFGASSGLDYTDLQFGSAPTGMTLDTSFGVGGWLINDTNLQVQFILVPEPSTLLLVGLLAPIGLWYGRRPVRLRRPTHE